MATLSMKAIVDGKQPVTITTPDGGTTTTTVDVTPTSDGKKELEIPTGPEGTTTTVTVPSTPTEGNNNEGGYPNGNPEYEGDSGYRVVTQTIAIDTPEGPGTVTITGPEVDGKQPVTITTPDGGTTTTTVDVTPTSDGKKELEIPTGPEGTTTTVTVPSTPTEGNNNEGGYPNGNPEYEGDSGYRVVTQTIAIDTPEGPGTVTITGPEVDGKQPVTITTPDGGTTTTTVDVTPTSDGKKELEIPTGPEGTTTTVTVPSTPTGGQTTTDILNQLGGNDVDNGDKDFMTKDEFQLQIGTHFSEKIMALKQQANDEDTETEKILKQQQQLDDCILQASNKFGYYGVYEQPPFFHDAVNWIDTDCLNQ
ncbi:unnamed protein product [Phytophthora lilii]|uniref:Unnamed protein product n=1 Tax=Phytophthora lilii TaxID=2077276 RepID=A0A9W6YHS6_9STRA|nr:unnamed protein product [Phytophthora lilii]